MFKNKQFEIIHNLLKSKKFAEANKLLIDSRKFGVLHPDYLFLMSMFLMENEITICDAWMWFEKVDTRYDFFVSVKP